MRVAFLTNFVSPYRLPVFQRLAKTPGWEFRILVNTAQEFDRSWQVQTGGLDVVHSKGLVWRRKIISPKPVRFEQIVELHVPTRLYSDLRKFRPDVVISCELGPRSLIAAAYCKRHRIPLVLWSYQGRVSRTQGTRRTWLRRWLLRQAAMIVGMGTQAREVLQAWGAPADRIVDAFNAADYDTLLRRLEVTAVHESTAQRKREVVGPHKMALVLGRMVPLKGTPFLLQAWRQVDPKIRENWRLVFVGEGPYRPMVERAAPEGVIYAGKSPAEEVVEWYLGCDLYIFPSMGDVWGLVVNEAMACGAPTLCSVHAACCDDMIRHGENGLVFDPTQEQAAVAALEDALCRDDLPQLGRAGQAEIGRFNLDQLADGFRKAVARACGHPEDHFLSPAVEPSLTAPETNVSGDLQTVCS
jgi:hypothetical protein